MTDLLEARDSLQTTGHDFLITTGREIQFARFVFPATLLERWYEDTKLNSMYANQPFEELTGLWVFRERNQPFPHAFWVRPMPQGHKESEGESLELKEPGNDKLTVRVRREFGGLLTKFETHRPTSQDFEAFEQFLRRSRRVFPT